MVAIAIPPQHSHLTVKDVFDVCRKGLFWTGFWPDDDEHHLNFYLKGLHPRVARRISNHRPLQICIQYFRWIYARFIISYLVINSFFLLPMAMIVNMDDKPKALDSIYAFSVLTFLNASLTTTFQRRNKLNNVLLEEEQIARTFLPYKQNVAKLDNYVLKACMFTTKAFNSYVSPCFTVFTLIYGGIFCYPKRMQFYNTWYPFDSTASPAYELTLSLHLLGIVGMMGVSCNLIAFVLSGLMYGAFMFHAIGGNIRDIKPIWADTVVGSSRVYSFMKPTSNYKDMRFTGGNRIMAPRRVHRLLGPTKAKAALRNTKHRVCIEPTNEHGTMGNILSRKLNIKSNHKLVKSINQHTRLLANCHEVNHLLQPFLISLYVINFLLYGTTFAIISNDEVDILKKIDYFIITFCITFLFLSVSAIGTYISQKSGDIKQAVYESDWLKASTSYKRSLVLVMTRANQPFEIKATGIGPMNLGLFSEVAKRAFKMTATIGEYLSET